MTDAAPQKSPMRRWAFRAAGSAVILALLFWFLPTDAIWQGFSNVPLSLFAGVFLAFLAGHVLAAAKWWALLDQGLPWGQAVRAHFAGLASNLCLPGVAGGDAVRAAIAQTHIKDGGRVVAGALADRLIDMLALACLSLIGILMVSGQGGGMGTAMQATGVLAVVLVGAVYVMPRVLPKLWDMFPKLPAKGLALRTADAFAELGRKPMLLIGAFLLSAAIQAMFVFLAVKLAVAVGIDLPFGAWLFAWPLAKILAVLPISLAGLGVREASLALLLAPFGAVAAQVVAAGLVWQAVLFLTGGLGALVMMVTGFGWQTSDNKKSNLSNQGH